MNTREPLLQRKCSCGGKADDQCPECQHGMQRRATNAAAPAVAPRIVHDVLRGSGRPMDAGVRGFMEPRFSHDFSRVRIHADARAAESATAVNAQAYTVGENIVFGRGMYTPHTVEGRRLLAHELTHFIQQSNARPSRAGELRISHPSDVGEKEAESTAKAIEDAGEARCSI